MATVPVTRTAVAGEVVLASHFNSNIRDPLNFLLAPPIFEANQTVAQTLTTGVATGLTFTTTPVIDSAGGHSTSTNPSRYTAVYPGWYVAHGGPCFAFNVTGHRLCYWNVSGAILNGTLVETDPNVGGAVTAFAARTKRMFLNVGSYNELFAFQNSGGNLATGVLNAEQSSFGMAWESN